MDNQLGLYPPLASEHTVGSGTHSETELELTSTEEKAINLWLTSIASKKELSSSSELKGLHWWKNVLGIEKWIPIKKSSPQAGSKQKYIWVKVSEVASRLDVSKAEIQGIADLQFRDDRVGLISKKIAGPAKEALNRFQAILHNLPSEQFTDHLNALLTSARTQGQEIPAIVKDELISSFPHETAAITAAFGRHELIQKFEKALDSEPLNIEKISRLLTQSEEGAEIHDLQHACAEVALQDPSKKTLLKTLIKNVAAHLNIPKPTESLDEQITAAQARIRIIESRESDVAIAFRKGFKAIVNLLKKSSLPKQQLLDQLNSLKEFGNTQERKFAARALQAFQALKKTSEETLTKESSQRGETIKPLSSLGMLKIAMVAEAKIAENGADSSIYLKKTTLGIDRSILIGDSKTWTVIVGQQLGRGADKKVKSGQTVSFIGRTANKIAAKVKPQAVLVNLDQFQTSNSVHKQLDKAEYERTHQLSQKSPYIANAHSWATYKTTKHHLMVNKQIFLAAPGLGSLAKYTYAAKTEQMALSNQMRFQFAADAAEGLESLHNNGYVHRDIKPENILTFETGAKIADLGRCIASDNTRVSKHYGTAIYTAPEMLLKAGPIQKPADVFAFGCTLYKIAFGKAPGWEAALWKYFTSNRLKPNHEQAVKLVETIKETIENERKTLENEGDAPETEFKRLILQMMDPDPSKRPDMTAVRIKLRELEAKAKE